MLLTVCYVPIILPVEFGKNPTTASQDILQTRKSDAEDNPRGQWDPHQNQYVLLPTGGGT